MQYTPAIPRRYDSIGDGHGGPHPGAGRREPGWQRELPRVMWQSRWTSPMPPAASCSVIGLGGAGRATSDFSPGGVRARGSGHNGIEMRRRAPPRRPCRRLEQGAAAGCSRGQCGGRGPHVTEDRQARGRRSRGRLHARRLVTANGNRISHKPLRRTWSGLTRSGCLVERFGVRTRCLVTEAGALPLRPGTPGAGRGGLCIGPCRGVGPRRGSRAGRYAGRAGSDDGEGSMNGGQAGRMCRNARHGSARRGLQSYTGSLVATQPMVTA